MSIKSELTKTTSYLRSARKAIIGRGGEISLTAGLKDLPDAIFNIPADASLAYLTDDSVAYEKIVPPVASRFAQVNKIGGMSYKSNNRLKLPDNLANIYNGVTISVDNGVITLNGTANDYIELTLYDGTGKDSSSCIFSVGTDLPSGISFRYPYYNEDFGFDEWFDALNNIISLSTKINMIIDSGTSFSNFKLYPMLNDGNTAMPFEPYFEGLRETKVTALKSKGANLLNVQADTSSPSNTASSNATPRFFEPNTIVAGIAYNNYYRAELATIVSRSDNSISFKNSNGYGIGFAFDLKPNTAYTFSCTADVERIIIGAAFYNIDGTYDSNLRTSYKDTYLTFTTNSCGKTVIVVVDYAAGSGETTVTLSNVMLNEGSTAVPYKLYRTDSVDTFPIAEDIQALDGYGQSNPDNPNEYNYIDFVRKVFVAYGHTVDGAWVAYAEISETDISDYLTNDNFIEVEGGGTIVADNEHEYDAPSTINYIVETAGV